MNRNITFRLSTMMFLQFFVWGAWYTSIAVYMRNFNMAELTHWPYTVNPIAAIVSPFFLGLIADRYFSTERVLAVMHILGGIVMFIAPMMVNSPTAFIVLLLLYNLCYMPTLGLANSLAFHNITNQEKQFPLIRVFGTIGWIVAGLFVSFVLGRFIGILPESALPASIPFDEVLPEQTPLPLYTTAIASLLLGLYSFSLPHTPPPAKGETVSARSILGVDALSHLGGRAFYVFIISSLLISIPLAAYYNFTQTFLEVVGFQRIAGTQTLGQMSEVIFMLLMPVFFVRLGVKWMLAVGMGAWALRYVLFALAAPSAVFWMIIFGIALHGICYDFFFVTGQIYVDKKSSPKIRGQAQGFLVFVTYGIGMLIGAQVAGNLYNSMLGEGASALTLPEFQGFWLIPAAFAVVIMVFFIAMFNDKTVDKKMEVEDEPDVSATPEPEPES